MGHLAARTIYRDVFLPRISYAAEIWSSGTKLVKSQKKLLSAQRAPLLAMTGAYNTLSTNCLPAVAGTMPLDLEIRLHAYKKELLRREITSEVLSEKESELFEEWQLLYETRIQRPRKPQIRQVWVSSPHWLSSIARKM